MHDPNLCAAAMQAPHRICQRAEAGVQARHLL